MIKSTYGKIKKAGLVLVLITGTAAAASTVATCGIRLLGPAIVSEARAKEISKAAADKSTAACNAASRTMLETERAHYEAMLRALSQVRDDIRDLRRSVMRRSRR